MTTDELRNKVIETEQTIHQALQDLLDVCALSEISLTVQTDTVGRLSNGLPGRQKVILQGVSLKVSL